LPDIQEYQSFDRICLTDTFQLSKFTQGDILLPRFFPINSERVGVQKKTPMTVIIGNPPYSVGQKSANDNSQNTSHPELEKCIKNTYAKESSATNRNSLYDTYIRLFVGQLTS
jgi:predicted helicase